MVYQSDPRSITIRNTSFCHGCGVKLNRGDLAYYWPIDGRIYCRECGGKEYKEFLLCVYDEKVYHGRGNPYYG